MNTRILHVRLTIDPQVSLSEIKTYLDTSHNGKGAVFKVQCGTLSLEWPAYRVVVGLGIGNFLVSTGLSVRLPDNGDLVSFGLAPRPNFGYVLSTEESLKASPPPPPPPPPPPDKESSGSGAS